VLTIHTALTVRLTGGGCSSVALGDFHGGGSDGGGHGGNGEGGGDHGAPPLAVAVSGERIAAVGPLDQLSVVYPNARVRRWSGTLTPSLVHDGPLPPADSPRERVHALLRRGATVVLESSLVGEPDALALRTAATRGGLAVLAVPLPGALVPGARADMAVFDAEDRCVATVLSGRLVHRRA
jgi:predicted amidohydrolase YtcJ